MNIKSISLAEPGWNLAVVCPDDDESALLLPVAAWALVHDQGEDEVHAVPLVSRPDESEAGTLGFYEPDDEAIIGLVPPGSDTSWCDEVARQRAAVERDQRDLEDDRAESRKIAPTLSPDAVELLRLLDKGRYDDAPISSCPMPAVLLDLADLGLVRAHLHYNGRSHWRATQLGRCVLDQLTRVTKSDRSDVAEE